MEWSGVEWIGIVILPDPQEAFVAEINSVDSCHPDPTSEKR
jgi:hypothetical protein